MLVEEDLVQVIKTVTDKFGQMMDAYRAGLVMAFRCGASGLLYPDNYLKDWGVKFGIGLGPHPVSESLQSQYDVDPPEITPAIRSIDQIMHPLVSSCAQLDMVMVSPAELRESGTVHDLADPGYMRRIAIIRPKQLKNPAGRLGIMQAAWERSRR